MKDFFLFSNYDMLKKVILTSILVKQIFHEKNIIVFPHLIKCFALIKKKEMQFNNKNICYDWLNRIENNEMIALVICLPS